MVNILVVDESSFMRNSIKLQVKNGGHNVVGIAKEGDEALTIYKQYKPDIVTKKLPGYTDHAGHLPYTSNINLILLPL
jgi:chemotaxis response regulator CheB